MIEVISWAVSNLRAMDAIINTWGYPKMMSALRGVGSNATKGVTSNYETVVFVKIPLGSLLFAPFSLPHPPASSTATDVTLIRTCRLVTIRGASRSNRRRIPERGELLESLEYFEILNMFINYFLTKSLEIANGVNELHFLLKKFCLCLQKKQKFV